MLKRSITVLLSILCSTSMGQELSFTSDRMEGLVREPTGEERATAKTFSSIGEGMRAQPVEVVADGRKSSFSSARLEGGTARAPNEAAKTFSSSAFEGVTALFE